MGDLCIALAYLINTFPVVDVVPGLKFWYSVATCFFSENAGELTILLLSKSFKNISRHFIFMTKGNQLSFWKKKFVLSGLHQCPSSAPNAYLKERVSLTLMFRGSFPVCDVESIGHKGLNSCLSSAIV